MATYSAAAMAEPFPTPVFEGSEKRIEIDFAPAFGGNGDNVAASLRCIGRPQLDMILDLAACCIVSARHGAAFDAYVLSESSLFVYPRKAILKTCGTTKLLAAVPGDHSLTGLPVAGCCWQLEVPAVCNISSL